MFKAIQIMGLGMAIMLSGCMTPPPWLPAESEDLPPAPVVRPTPPPKSAQPKAPAVAKRPPLPPVRTLPPRMVPPPPPPPPPQPARRSPLQVAAVQAALDRAGFSPNLVDGRWGSRSRLAVAAWLESRGYPPAEDLSPAQEAELLGAESAEIAYVVTESDAANLAPVPSGWVDKSQLPALEHETVLERIAEKFHTSETWLRERNPAVAWPSPPAGTALTVPNAVSPSRPAIARRIDICLSQRSIRAYDASDRIFAIFPCSIAARVEKRPQGELRVVTAAKRPNYTFDPALFAGENGTQGITRKLLIPPGPNNPVGLAWISLNLPGYGMHGTPRPEDIGKTESHGCFRLANWNAERLLRMVEPGTPVNVQN